LSGLTVGTTVQFRSRAVTKTGEPPFIVTHPKLTEQRRKRLRARTMPKWMTAGDCHLA
jgi:hypothetical protein